MTEQEYEIVNRVIDRMTWNEIHAFQNEMAKGQDYREDAGGYFLRGLRRLFGLKNKHDVEIITYQQAAKAMVEELTKRES